MRGSLSKDEILGKVFAAGAGNLNGFGSVYLVLWVLGLAGAFMTAFYMFRAVYMTFHGEFRGTHEQRHHLHESPKSMTVPLVILALGSVVAGFLGIGKALSFNLDINAFEHFLHPISPALEVEHAPALATEWVLILISVAVAVAGILLGPEVLLRARGVPAPASPRRTLPYPLHHRRQQVLRGRDLRGHRGGGDDQPRKGLLRVRRRASWTVR